jgi:hypothetical protein
MKPLNKDAIIVVVSNPVDILTHFARQLSGLPATQVLGSGTSLDSARLRGRLAQELEVSPNSVNAYVLGEHGDSQFVSSISPLTLHDYAADFRSSGPASQSAVPHLSSSTIRIPSSKLPSKSTPQVQQPPSSKPRAVPISESATSPHRCASTSYRTKERLDQCRTIRRIWE